MEKLIGTFDYQVFVDCPNDECGAYLDLVCLQDEGRDLSVVIGGNQNPGKWDELGLEFTCPDCGTEFVLDKIEY